MQQIKFIPLEKLKLDNENPRLPSSFNNKSENDIMHGMDFGLLVVSSKTCFTLLTLIVARDGFDEEDVIEYLNTYNLKILIQFHI
jgi:hypothetical protein